MKYIKLFDSMSNKLVKGIGEDEFQAFHDSHRIIDVDESDLMYLKKIIHPALKSHFTKSDCTYMLNNVKIIDDHILDTKTKIMVINGVSLFGGTGIFKYDDDWWVINPWKNGHERFFLSDSKDGLEEYFRRFIQ